MELGAKEGGGPCLYAVVGKNRLEELTALRLEFIRELHPEFSGEKLKGIESASREYVEWLLADDSYAGFIGVVDSAIVCTAALLVYRLPPLGSPSARKIGHVLNFYSRPAYRHKGYGRGLMEYIQEYGREGGFSRLFLNATDEGYPLYRKCGFTDAPKAMEFNY